MFMYRCTEYLEKKKKKNEKQGCFFLPPPTVVGGGKRVVPKEREKKSRLRETRDLGLYVRTYVCLSGRVFVSVCIAVPSAKRIVQEHAEVHEHVLHGDVHCRVHTEDRSIRREGRLHIPPNIPLSSSSQYISNKARFNSKLSPSPVVRKVAPRDRSPESKAWRNPRISRRQRDNCQLHRATYCRDN